ncbi:MAG: amidohydrolase family protein [Bacteroidales bacterium]|nr:amidohydrolase family protein [Bacteroidales bacterium]
MRRLAAKYLYTLTSPEPIVNGFVELDIDGSVIRTGVSEEPSLEEEWYDGALVPGFVNAHCHVELSYLKGMFRKGSGMAGFIDQINALRDTTTRERKIAAIREQMNKMWDAGVSAMADISNCDDSFAIKSGHPIYTRTFLEVFGTEPEDCPAIIADVRALNAKAKSFDLDAAPTPHACYTMSPELLTAASIDGLKSGFLSFHSEESPEEEEMLISGSGPMWENRKAAGMSTPPVTGEISLKYFLGRLLAALETPVDGNVLLVHEVCLNEYGVSIARRILAHPFIAICPRSNMFIHNALPPIGLMRESGIPICVGTDSLSSNDSLDMVSELLCLQENFSDVPLGEMLIWACRNGAEFLDKRTILGSIEPGKRPGIVLIDGLSQDGRLTDASASRRLV